MQGGDRRTPRRGQRPGTGPHPSARGADPGARARRPDATLRRRRLGLLAGVLVLLLLGAAVLRACGGDEPGTPTAAPTAGPADPPPSTATEAAPAPPPTELDRARRAAAGLSARRLAGQRLVVAFRDPGTVVPDALRRAIRAGDVAGVILFAENGGTTDALRPLVRELQDVPRPDADPLLVTVDQEGGPVRRVTDAPPDRTPPELGAAGTDAARSEGRETARALRRTGITVDFAPVADLGRPGRALTGEGRTFGAAPGRVGAVASAFARGLEDGGVAATAKHYPGIGGLQVNTDDAPGEIDLDRATLRTRDGAPFRALVEADVPLIMMSSAVYPALDPGVPAVLSRDVVQGGARRSLGFDGVIVSDDLEAQALAQTTPPAEVALGAAGAGVDLLLYATSLEGGLAAGRTLTAALRERRLPRAAAEASAARVLALRARLAER